MTPCFSTQVAKMVLMMLVSAVPLIVMWSCPVLILRNRIRERKAQELHNIMLALQGQDVTLTVLRLRRGEFTDSGDTFATVISDGLNQVQLVDAVSNSAETSATNNVA